MFCQCCGTLLRETYFRRTPDDSYSVDDDQWCDADGTPAKKTRWELTALLVAMVSGPWPWEKIRIYQKSRVDPWGIHPAFAVWHWGRIHVILCLQRVFKSSSKPII